MSSVFQRRDQKRNQNISLNKCKQTRNKRGEGDLFMKRMKQNYLFL